MTKGENIKHAIFKEVSAFSFVEWLKGWGIDKADWDKFMEAGKESVDREEDA